MLSIFNSIPLIRDIISAILIAATMYSLFNSLDRSASEVATQAIAQWLNGIHNTSFDVRLIILGLFDRIYSTPLLTLKALCRLIIISVTITLMVCLFYFSHEITHESTDSETWLVIKALFVANIVSGYCGLFVTRQSLLSSSRAPIISTILAIAFGFALVAWINTVIINLISLWVEGHDIGNVWSATNDLFISPQSTEVIRTADIVVVVLPAFVANIWAVLFLVSGLTARLFFVLFPAIR
jgi:hypothetical protein